MIMYTGCDHIVGRRQKTTLAAAAARSSRKRCFVSFGFSVSLSLLLLLLVSIICGDNLVVQAAPLSSEADDAPPAAAAIGLSGKLESWWERGQHDPKTIAAHNQCENDQDRKDLCERCSRFATEGNASYLGCCTNYDGIFNFCEKFLNYSFGQSAKIISGSHFFRK